MKALEIVKNAVGAVRDLLGGVPHVTIESVECEPNLDYRCDAVIGFTHKSKSLALVVEVKANGAPRFVRSAVLQLESGMARLKRSGKADAKPRLIPMIVSPYLSPESRAICDDHKFAYLDLFGNAKLAFDAVYVERAVAQRPVSETRALRSFFTPRAAAILRVLLRDLDRSWRVADLAAQANASFGHVSNVRKALLDREWLEVRDDGIALVQPDVLLKTWRENYRSPVGKTIEGYTHLHGKQLEERLRGRLNSSSDRPRAIYSLHSAAHWLAPFGRTATHSFHVDESGADAVKEAIELTHAARGANVVLQVLSDESLFEDASEPAPGVFCTSPIVTYLDLWNGNERDREAADHLAGEFFSWLN